MSSENNQIRRWWYSYLNRLKNYVPDRLFAESVLPRVPIKLAGGGPEYEDVSLALSTAGYLPGKPTYRVGHERGFFIPFLSVPSRINNLSDGILSEVKSLLFSINYYYHVSQPLNNKLDMPNEYQYLIGNILNNNNVEITRLTGINGDTFRCRLGNNNAGVRWVFYSRKKTNSLFNLLFSNNANYKFYIYLSTSTSYPRYFTAEQRAEPNNKFVKFCDALKSIFGDGIVLRDANNDIYVGVYAFDVSARIRGPLRINQNKLCIVRNRNNQNTDCIYLNNINNNYYDGECVSDNIPANVFIYNFVKIPMRIDSENKAHPVVIGYVIKNTRYLEMRPTRLMQDELLGIFNDVKNSQINSDPSSDRKDLSYAELSINTALINMLRHILSHDLVIEHYLTLLGFTKPDEFINLVFLYYDLHHYKGLYTLLNNRNISDVSKKLIDIIREFLPKLNSNDTLVLRYLLTRIRKGGRLERLYIDRSNDEYWNKVQKRLEDILGNYNQIAKNLGGDVWALGVLFDMARHTLGHHLIRVVSNSGGVRPDKLLEIYREITDQKVAIVERDAGGIGVLNVDNAGRLSIWRSDLDALEDLLLSLGKCLVGVPEDIIHFAWVKKWIELVKNWDDDIKLREVFKSVADELGIFLTPDELEETIKHWRSIYDEASKLAEIVDQNQSNINKKTNPLIILSDVHDLRYEFERKYRRFPDFDEFVTFAILNINKYPYLKTLILTLFRRALISRGIVNMIEQLFRGGNSSESYDRFISEIRDSLYNKDTIIAQEVSKERGKIRSEGEERVQGGVIDALITLRWVVSSVLTRLALLSCNSACGMCYLNTRSCGRFGSPFDQVRTLDRRVLRILASRIVRDVGEEVRQDRLSVVLYGKDPVVELGGKEYVLRCADHDHSLQRA